MRFYLEQDGPYSYMTNSNEVFMTENKKNKMW